MPPLDVATAQASLQNHLGPLRAGSLVHCKNFSSPFTFGDEKILVYRRNSFRFPKKLNSRERSKLQINAVATLEPKCLVLNEDRNNICENNVDVNSDPSTIEVECSNLEWMDLDERERLRRMRISKANRGNTPWNKGRKHSAETLRRIKERTRLAMQDPKVKMKLACLGHAQSKETRKKIGVGVRMGWQKRREKLMAQETCRFEWQNLIAEASRRGYVGEEELQWDSYKIMSEKLELELVESVERRKILPRAIGSKRAPKSLEQRRKIAEAIAAKWADPEYRNRVCCGLAKYHGTSVGVERKRRRIPSGGAKSPKPVEKNASDTNNSSRSDTTSLSARVRSRRSKTPLYKDPLASSKLEMIKNIRAQRAAMETKKAEAIEQARLLVAEAEKAAVALELAAMKSPIARASLIETRKLIAEALQYLEYIDAGYAVSNENGSGPFSTPTEVTRQVEKEINMENGDFNQAERGEVNGAEIVASSKDEDCSFTILSFHNIQNGGKELLPPSSSGYGLPLFNLESLIEQSSPAKQINQSVGNVTFQSEMNPLPCSSEVRQSKKSSDLVVTSTKRWVRGRLVEVTKGTSW